MAYSLGAVIPSRLAAIAPQCGSFAKGFLAAPDANIGIPLMDIHGVNDAIVPANLTRFNIGDDVEFPLSSDGWYYTKLDDILQRWRHSNNCTGLSSQYVTDYDGVSGL